MSNEFVAATDAHPAGVEPGPARVAPVLEMIAADDALLCVDDACLPPKLRDRDNDAATVESNGT